jgi:dTDP-4-amino-4,6-dideoxygalactose transaminase
MGAIMNPFDVVADFEAAIAEYTGSPYVVAVNSCTAALRLALKYITPRKVILPCKTYISVPMAVIWAGHEVGYEVIPWEEYYLIQNTDIVDSARYLEAMMYEYNNLTMCLSFHPQKPFALSVGGGAILHSDPVADKWYRRMRYDGRTHGVATKDDDYTMIGEHCYMFPATAAEGIHKLSIYAKQRIHPEALGSVEDYPDCSKYPALCGRG